MDRLKPWETKFKLDASVQPAKWRKISKKDVSPHNVTGSLEPGEAIEITSTRQVEDNHNNSLPEDSSDASTAIKKHLSVFMADSGLIVHVGQLYSIMHVGVGPFMVKYITMENDTAKAVLSACKMKKIFCHRHFKNYRGCCADTYSAI